MASWQRKAVRGGALGGAEHAIMHGRAWLRLDAGVAALLFLGCLLVYARTAAPSVMSGDGAEFQLAAVLLGVPHPTTYPLYIMLGKLATVLLPWGDLAHRVTLVSAWAAAGAATLLFALARRITGSTWAAALAALALAVAPGMWNAATMAEVYALLALLLAAFGWCLLADWERVRADAGASRRWLFAAALVAGLAFSHHGLFAFVGMPLFGCYVFWTTFGMRTAERDWRVAARQVLVVAACFAAGLLPWLYPLVQYARYGPFHGEDYGLPRHYFWGAPTSWLDAFNQVLGGQLRDGVFRVPAPAHVLGSLRLIGERVWFEFGLLGTMLGALGCVALFRQRRDLWNGAAAVWGGTVLYVGLLGPAVQDAPIFTLPMLLPWALWVAVGALVVARGAARLAGNNSALLRAGCAALLLGAMLAWGYTRVPYGNKRHQWLFREWGQAVLHQVPPHALIIAHWEQGMLLQYLVLAEGQRPDVLVDVVEPSDVPWATRAAQRADGRPVFFAGTAPDVAGMPVALVRHDGYADLFQLGR